MFHCQVTYWWHKFQNYGYILISVFKGIYATWLLRHRNMDGRKFETIRANLAELKINMDVVSCDEHAP